MIIIPAIDLLNGRAVRLVRGDYEQVTDFGDPVTWLEHWRDAGASLVHVVDLDGAREGTPVQLELIRELATFGVPLQVGGGIRTQEDMEAIWTCGVERMVIGTQAVERPDLIAHGVATYEGAIVVAIDSRDGLVATRGWLDTADIHATELARRLGQEGVPRFLVTDVGRDGTLTEPNYDLLTDVMDTAQRPVIASGGVTTVEAIIRLRELNLEAAIVGRALYDRVLSFDHAVEAAGAG
jgi:phosphoribosylformimino-5-aminoimidazole carboxamide ribotide isomerase